MEAEVDPSEPDVAAEEKPIVEAPYNVPVNRAAIPIKVIRFILFFKSLESESDCYEAVYPT